MSAPPRSVTRSRVRFGLLGGIAAGAVTIGIAQLGAGIWLRAGWTDATPSPVLAVGAAFIDRTPPWLKDLAVSTFGAHDKQVLLVGMALVLLVLSAGMGMLLAWTLRASLMVCVVLVAVAAAAVLSRPGAAPVDVVPLLVGGVVGLSVLAVWHRRMPSPGGPAAEDRSVLVPARRTVLGATAGAVVAGSLLTLAGRAAAGSTRAVQHARKVFRVPRVPDPVSVPEGVSVDVPGVTPYLSPAHHFYRVDTALSVPQVDPDQWRLRVTGMVDHEVEIDWTTLRDQPMHEAMITLMCVSNPVGGHLNGNAIWTGWPVRELLARAGVRHGADMVLSTSADGWTAGTPLRALTDDRHALLAVGMDRKPLLPEHGFPVRMVVPGLYGYVSATKWVTDLKVTTYADDAGYWTPRGWSAKGPVKTSSRFDVPHAESTVHPDPDGTVVLAGVAWAQHRGVRAVQVRVDDGAWQQARLAASGGVDVWRQWVHRWTAHPGRHRLQVRAVDGHGQVQTAEQAPPAPDGSSGYHTISVTVT